MPQVDVRFTHRPDETVRIDEGDVPHVRHQGLLAGEPVPVTVEPPDLKPDPQAGGPAGSAKPPKGAKAATEGSNPE